MSDDRPRCEHLVIYPMDNCTVCMSAEIEKLRKQIRQMILIAKDWRTTYRSGAPDSRRDELFELARNSRRDELMELARNRIVNAMLRELEKK